MKHTCVALRSIPAPGCSIPARTEASWKRYPILRNWGVTAVELMPAQEFNGHQTIRSNPHTDQPLGNYWGYDPVAFSAPKAS